MKENKAYLLTVNDLLGDTRQYVRKLKSLRNYRNLTCGREVPRAVLKAAWRNSQSQGADNRGKQKHKATNPPAEWGLLPARVAERRSPAEEGKPP